tara:strand:+ start:177 stop:332 length:156 start_codon:yes stop_codon:yes gene_type:complete
MKKIPLKGGLEQDMLTKWRRFIIAQAGKAKEAKQTYNRRLRKTAREEEKEL